MAHEGDPIPPKTVWLYASKWAAFVNLEHVAERQPLRADPDTIMPYAASLAGTLNYGMLMLRLAAIADQHRLRGRAVPATDRGWVAFSREAHGSFLSAACWLAPASGFIVAPATTDIEPRPAILCACQSRDDAAIPRPRTGWTWRRERQLQHFVHWAPFQYSLHKA
jgi:hypothetical protein